MDKKLQICATIKDGFSLGFSNFLSVIAITLLYLLTIWIPYLNVGTTIAFSALPAEMAKGKVVNPFYIFDGKYRRNMGEFFILYALMSGAIMVGFCFMLIPGLVISLAWNFAIVLFVDKNLNAIESLRESNRITYGNKWRIFWIYILLCIVLFAIAGIIIGIFYAMEMEVLAVVLYCLFCLLLVPVLIGADASIYRQLTTGKLLGKIEAPKALEAPVAAKAPEAPEVEKKAAPKAKKAAPKADKAPKAEKPKAEKKPAAKAKKPAAKTEKPKAAPKAKKAKE